MRSPPGLTIGVAELLGALPVRFGVGGGQTSPVVAGDAFVDRTPDWLKDFAVRTFGENDKMVCSA